MIDDAFAAIRARTALVPRAAVVLGSGLGGFADRVEGAVEIPYGEIPGWPVSTALGHSGTLVLGTFAGVPLAVMKGRAHLYEGHPADRVVFGVRVLGRLGAGTLVLTNACGGVRESLAPGDLVIVSDHLNLQGTSPLVGPNDDTLGPRFLGTWVRLAEPFGAVSLALAKAVNALPRSADVEEIEGTWAIECDTRFSPLVEKGATVLSWAALADARREFLSRLNTIRRDLKSVDQTNLELKRLDISRLVGPAINKDPRIREFVRGVFLSGNGSLVFPNSFAQWASSEALRRAEPRALIAAFGIRQKIKPFSGTVLFEDQARGNPVADQDDPAGSLIDALLLSDYVRLSAMRTDAYRDRTLVLMAAHELDRVLLIGAKPPGRTPLSGAQLTELASGWLTSA